MPQNCSSGTRIVSTQATPRTNRGRSGKPYRHFQIVRHAKHTKMQNPPSALFNLYNCISCEYEQQGTFGGETSTVIRAGTAISNPIVEYEQCAHEVGGVGNASHHRWGRGESMHDAIARYFTWYNVCSREKLAQRRPWGGCCTPVQELQKFRRNDGHEQWRNLLRSNFRISER